jgi:hypothetical protein
MVTKRLKAAVKLRMPFLVPLYSRLYWTLILRPRWRKMGAAAVFAEHYRKNGWGSDESFSGTGSTVANTTAIRAELPNVIRELEIKSIIDIPCGDFNWMRLLDLSIPYLGCDIVDEIVAENARKFRAMI